MSNTIQNLDKYSNIVDIPLSGDQQDLLGVDRYVNALARFIQRAKTPSTLSIQGEWGSGKTSLMNQIHQKLCKQDANDSKPYRGVWLNIWKLSLMHTPEQTLAQVINEITKQILEILEHEYGGYKDERSDFWNQVDFKKVGKSALKALFKGAVNLGATYVGAGPIVNAENSSEPKEKTITSIPDLQNSMEAVIQYCWRKDREKKPNAKGFLFFIDDLDRLDPTVAVSVLELLKNVFEVEHCVFILAIDYEVVVRGLIPKFGEFNDKTERQFRSFFDKIIQLPFNMPVQSYDTKSYVTNALNNIDYFTSEELDQLTNIVEDDYEFSQDLEEDDIKTEEVSEDDYLTVAEVAVELLKLSVGSNPRSMIRLVNSLSLNQIMWEDADNESSEKIKLTVEEKLINLGFTCIQISYGSIYTLINNNPCFFKWDEAFAEQSRLSQLSAQDQKELELSKEKISSWQIVIRRAVQNNIYMRQHRRNIEKLLLLIAKLAVGTDLNNISANENNLKKLEDKFYDLLSFSAVTDAGVSTIQSERRVENRKRKFAYADFQSAFYKYAFSKAEMKQEFSQRKVSQESYMNFGIGLHGIYLTLSISPTKNKISVCIYINENINLYRRLFAYKDQIEERCGMKFAWYELLSRAKRAKSKIEITKECDLKSNFPDNMGSYFDWICNVMLKMKREFVFYIKRESSN